MWRPAIQQSHETFITASPHGDQEPCIKRQAFGVFPKKKHEEQKQLLKAATSSNVSALRASFLVANRIAKAKKPFTTGEELILPAAKDICRELLGEATVQKVARVPLPASTITRRIDEIAEDIEAQLLERINGSPWAPSLGAYGNRQHPQSHILQLHAFPDSSLPQPPADLQVGSGTRGPQNKETREPLTQARRPFCSLRPAGEQERLTNA
ncbi:hypothetical protein J1605_000167 [Eschrichtius robustus]|uniref:Uncharacterized protein n=1 Tax=Eschrichtius robustus TaxID=9764 RepID=A0AB34HP07_ESCRO|nr:hypothetical protein J1605_000167 [Eschrichtius robustus]